MKLPAYTLLSAICAALLPAIQAAEPPGVDIVVRDQSNQVIHKQTVRANDVFETEKLEGGTYTVFFKARGEALKGAQYALFLNAGKNKVMEDALPGERLGGAGVAMNINVPRSCTLAGQVANGQTVYGGKRVFKVKIVNGRRYVWQPPSVSSNIPGRWIEDGAADAYNVQRFNPEWLRKFQDHTAGALRP